MSHRHLCVHGHFYQPPRENPWLGIVEREPSAAPFADWNARIADECYGPMTLGVRAGSDGRAIAYEDLLRRISFNFGATLLSWLERERPSLYRRVLAADAASAKGDGLGNAIAQPYYHAILPLMARRDQDTMIRWGLADFKARFGRDAKGMWLPETAVDDEALDALAAAGLAFTILCPTQAEAVRPLSGGSWEPTTPETLDPKTPYLWISPKDPSRRLAVFFYHNRLSRGVVSGESVASATSLAEAVQNRLLPGDGAQLVHIASDGEFYGHHHPGAERVLTLALDLLASEGIEPINHSRFLALFPPPREVKIRQKTAWSCAHGLGRWERDCGCRSAHLPDWNQEWRAPLRDALDKLAKRLDLFYEDEASLLFHDPWAARDASVALLLDPTEAAADRFLTSVSRQPLDAAARARALRLLAMQRERLAMYTSCGWFFDDLSGVETILILRRAARAMELGRLIGEDTEPAFVARLAEVRPNLDGLRTGAEVWKRLVLPGRVDLERAAAHAAILDHLGRPAGLAPALSVELGPAFRADKKGLAGRDRSLTVLTASVARPETRERAEFAVVVHRADRLDFACWLRPRSDGPFDSSALGADFLALDDDAFRAKADSLLAPARFGLDAVLADERAELFRVLAPEGGLGPDRAVYLKRWADCVAAVRRGGTDDDALLSLLVGATDHSFRPEDLPWSGHLEDLLHERLAAVLAAPAGAAEISRALRWLDAMWNTGLLASAWRLRDFQDRWGEALAPLGPCAALDACRALGERLGRADAIKETA